MEPGVKRLPHIRENIKSNEDHNADFSKAFKTFHCREQKHAKMTAECEFKNKLNLEITTSIKACAERTQQMKEKLQLLNDRKLNIERERSRLAAGIEDLKKRCSVRVNALESSKKALEAAKEMQEATRSKQVCMIL